LAKSEEAEPLYAACARDKAPPTQRKVAEQLWTKCWKNIPQSRVQRWIERILYYIQEIIDLKEVMGIRRAFKR
jgi:hypothetical protein